MKNNLFKFGLAFTSLSLLVGVVSTASVSSNSKEATIVKASTSTPASESTIKAYIGDVWDSTSTGNTLRGELENLVYNKLGSYATKAYTTLSPKYSDNDLCNAYEDPENPNNMLLYYSNDSVLKGVTDGSVNKEHIWPNSRGCGESGPAGDPWLIAPSNSKDNSSRGNDVFGVVSGTYDPASCGDTTYRGIAARAILYGATVYWHHPGKNSNPLELSDKTGYTSGENMMGMISKLLEWNLQYPADAREFLRNEYLYTTRNCRNPFVDKPSYACKIWGDYNEATKAICGSSVVPDPDPEPEPEITPIELEQTEIEINVGDSIQIGVKSGFVVSWESSDEDVCLVDRDGYLFPVAEGFVTITAKNAESSATCFVIVTDYSDPVDPPKSDDKKLFGCSGSIITSSVLITITSLIGICLVTKKKKMNS